MTIEEAYNLAKENGYDGRIYSKNGEYFDREFWRCLGKAKGWGKITHRNEKGEEVLIEGWVWQWHAFVACLIEGGSIEEYFQGIN